ncbi:hypothetical protein [uncultured Methanobrevibacter sp.]|uniref:hypothetical protein n=1 Tax=uncultured Methanobrevibacter sp. TaxID=253161 RepID=UPI0025DA0D3A|nr:hypothetical protein [uncultured Methanobrevibacter sp.]
MFTSKDKRCRFGLFRSCKSNKNFQKSTDEIKSDDNVQTTNNIQVMSNNLITQDAGDIQNVDNKQQQQNQQYDNSVSIIYIVSWLARNGPYSSDREKTHKFFVEKSAAVSFKKDLEKAAKFLRNKEDLNIEIIEQKAE